MIGKACICLVFLILVLLAFGGTFFGLVQYSNHQRKNDPSHRLLKFAVHGFARSAEASLKAGNNAVNVNKTDVFGVSALYLAAHWGKVEVLDVLLQYGADPNLGDALGMTPLHIAANLGYVKVFQSLLIHGADPNSRTLILSWTPLHMSVNSGQRDIVEHLLLAGGDPTARDIFGATPLHSAANLGDYEISRILLDNLASSSTSSPSAIQDFINSRNAFGWTPLMLASYNGHAHVAKLLLNKGADPDDLRPRLPYLPLFSKSVPDVGMEKGHKEVLKLLERARKSRELDRAEEQLVQLRNHLGAIQEKRTETDGPLDSEQELHEKELREESASFASELESLARELEVQRSEYSKWIDEVNLCSEELDRAKAKLIELSAQIDAIQAEKTESERLLDRRTALYEKEMSEKTAQHVSELEASNKELEGLKLKYSQAIDDLKASTEELDRANAQTMELRAQIDAIQAEKTESDRLFEREKALYEKQASEKWAQHTSELEALTNELAELKLKHAQEIDDLKLTSEKKLNRMRGYRVELLTRIDVIEAEKADIASLLENEKEFYEKKLNEMATEYSSKLESLTIQLREQNSKHSQMIDDLKLSSRSAIESSLNASEEL